MFRVSSMYMFWLVTFIMCGQILMSGNKPKNVGRNHNKIKTNVTQAELSQFTQKWEQFKRANCPSITPSKEEIYKKTFINNLKLIKDHNSKTSSYKLDMNKKFALHNFYIQVSKVPAHNTNGCAKTPHSSSECKVKKLLPMNRSLTLVDWRQNMGTLLTRTTRVKDQGSCSSCWAFSAVAVYEGWLASKTKKIEEFSPQQLVDCSDRSRGCKYGNSVSEAFQFLKSNNLATLKMYPYKGEDTKCRQIYSNHTFKMKCASVTFESEDQLREAVRQRGPVSVSIYANLYTFKFYESGIYDDEHCRKNLSATHAVTVVGYVSDKYWIIKNSWGEEWGERGYMKMAMDKDMCGIANHAYYAIDDNEEDDDEDVKKKKDKKVHVGTGSCARLTSSIFHFTAAHIMYFVLYLHLHSS